MPRIGQAHAGLRARPSCVESPTPELLAFDAFEHETAYRFGEISCS